LGISRRPVQDWEAGVNHPTAPRLQVLITALLEARALTSGREAAEARRQLQSSTLRTGAPAPDVRGFVDRTDEPATVRQHVWISPSSAET
jgi:hypothetical protein